MVAIQFLIFPKTDTSLSIANRIHGLTRSKIHKDNKVNACKLCNLTLNIFYNSKGKSNKTCFKSNVSVFNKIHSTKQTSI